MKINFLNGMNPRNIAICLIALSFVLIWQANKTYSGIAAIRDEIKNQEIVVNDAEKTLQRVRDFTGFVQKNKEIISKFDLILPDGEEKHNLLSTLDGIAGSNGLVALGISFGKETDKKNQQKETLAVESDAYGFTPVDINMSLRGDYSSFNNFLLAIEKNLRILDVVSVDFSDNSSSDLEEGGKREYSYNIILRTYFNSSAKEENIAKLLNSGKFKNFMIESLGFTKEKIFNGLFLSSDYDINIKEDEIGKHDLF